MAGSPSKSQYIFRIIIVIVVVAGVAALLLNRNQISGDAINAWVQSAGIWAPLLFVAIYAVGAIFFLPATVMTLAGGALFGPLLGSLYNIIGATSGAGLAFLVSRYLASDWVEAKAQGRLKQLVTGVEREGWRFVAFVRLVPLFPFILLNYALGVTRVKFSHYLLATFVCMYPATAAYTYLGYAGRAAFEGNDGAIQKALLALTLLALVAFIPRLVSRFRAGKSIDFVELQKRIAAQSPCLLLDVRSPQEYVGEFGHITGSQNIPLGELAGRLDEIQDWLEKPVAVICRTDRRATRAARLLAKHGFVDVLIVREGMSRWQQYRQDSKS